MTKLLSVAVPAYNAAPFLEKCLTSFLCPAMQALEIIVINDGSTDDTASIAAGFAARYPEVFRVVNKENGGHGSGVNAAARLATGKYFRVVDADDWVCTENLAAYLSALEQTDADAVLTHFHTVNAVTGERIPFINRGAAYDTDLTPEALRPVMDTAARWFCIHALAYRTAFYQALGLTLSEKIFYEDTEYAVLPFAGCKTVRLLDLFIYEYRIGDVSQSVSIQSYCKRYTHLERVLGRLLDAYGAQRGQAADMFMETRLAMLLGTYEKVMLVYLPERRRGREAVSVMRRRVREAAPATARRSLGRHMALLGCHAIRLDPARLEAAYAGLRRRKGEKKGNR